VGFQRLVVQQLSHIVPDSTIPLAFPERESRGGISTGVRGLA